jgi:hypothetical protein
MQPSEFWKLPICDFWAELDSKLEEARQIKAMTDGLKGGSVGGNGNVFSHAEWEDARRRHREKVANDRTRGA